MRRRGGDGDGGPGTPGHAHVPRAEGPLLDRDRASSTDGSTSPATRPGAAPGRPTVVVANHTNALADPVVILAKLPGHPRFLAAGSWWKFAPARYLFRLAGVVPVFRRGDGGGSNANLATFAACHEALAEGATIAVFPEGELHNEPSIAPLKTGAARIALGAAADAGVHDIALLPVGIVYEDRGRFRSQAAVQVGAPVPVDPWVDRYRADPRATVRALTDEVARGLRAVTVNHESWADLRLVDRAATVALADDDTSERRYARRNELRRGLGAARARTGGHDDPAWADLAGTRGHPPATRSTRSGWTSTTRCRRRTDSPASGVPSGAVLAAVAPAAAMGAVTNAPIAAAMKGVTLAVKDPAWQATSKGVAGVVLCPIVWGTEAFLLRRHGRRVVLGVLVAAPLGGLAWIGWREGRARWRQVRAEETLARHPGRRAAGGRVVACRGPCVRRRPDRSSGVGARRRRDRCRCRGGSVGERLDHVVDRPRQDRDVVGLDGREHRDAQLVASELAVRLGVDDAVRRGARPRSRPRRRRRRSRSCRPRGCARRAWRRRATRPHSPRPSRTGSRRCGRTGSRPTRVRRGRASSRPGRRGGTAWPAPACCRSGPGGTGQRDPEVQARRHPAVGGRDPLDAGHRGRRDGGEPEPAVAGEVLLRREVVDVGLRGVEAQPTRPRGRVDEHELVGAGAVGPTDREHDAGRGLVLRASSTRRRRRSPAGSGWVPGALSITSGSSRWGAAFVAAANFDENSPHTRCWLRALDQPERGRVPERGGAAVAEQHLVAVGEGEQLREAGADATAPPTCTVDWRWLVPR